jgi:hypothetical protein
MTIAGQSLQSFLMQETELVAATQLHEMDEMNFDPHHLHRLNQ